MTSSLEGKGGVGQKMTSDDMMTRGGKEQMTKYPLISEVLGKPQIILNIFQGTYQFKHISKVISNTYKHGKSI